LNSEKRGSWVVTLAWSAEGVKLDRDLAEIFQNSFLAADAKWRLGTSARQCYRSTALACATAMAKLGHDSPLSSNSAGAIV